MTVSIVIPVYNDTPALTRTIAALRDAPAEIIVAATADDRAALEPLRASAIAVRWLEAGRGRARQMNAGAAAATGDWIIFLHADTQLPANWSETLAAASADPRVSLGCFRFALDSPSVFARVIEFGVRLRVRVFGLPYGDQALFVRRRDFAAAGGYAEVPIMEDVDLVRRFRARGRLYRAAQPAVTSAREWERDGWIVRTGIHLWLIALYFLGVPPERLAASP